MNQITTAADLQAALELDRCVIFLWVNWAVQAWESSTLMRKVLERMAAERAPLLPIFKLDLSNQQGEIWDAARAWLKESQKDGDALAYDGYGALFFVIRGRPVRVVPRVAEQMTDASLISAITAFGQVGTEAPRSLS